MKYSLELDINLPRGVLVELFDNMDNLKHWQPDLVSWEYLDDHPGEPGSQAKLVYKMGKGEIEMIETIVKRSLPDEFSATYEAKGVWNSVENYFIEVDSTTTTWVFGTEFKFTGIVMRLFAILLPGAFKKKSFQYMLQFKEFAESQIA
ncbi:MAG: SRPBCC family protein [Puniceicoccaceae bacterium]